MEQELLPAARKELVVLLPKQSLCEEREMDAPLRAHRHTHRGEHFKNGHIPQHAKFNITTKDGRLWTVS